MKSPSAEDLLASAVRTLTSGEGNYTDQDWRITMAKAQANEKQAALKDATKKAAAKGITKPKHKPAEGAVNVGPEKMTAEEISQTRAEAHADALRGVDTVPAPVVNSGFSIFNQSSPTTTSEGKTMSNKPEAPKDLTQAQIDKKAEFDRKAAEKQAQIAAREQAAIDKAAKKAEREAAAKQTAEQRAAAKAEREAQAAANKQAREAKIAELAATGTRKYLGSMLSLAERVKAGAYVKGLNGQLRSTDPLAEALDAVPPANVILLGLKALALDANPYAALNVGQQSMNLRNKMRGAIKAGKLTIEQVKAIRDENGYATAEDAAAKRAEAKAAREAKAAEAKALKEKAKAEADAKKAEAKAAAEAAKLAKEQAKAATKDNQAAAPAA